MKRFSIVLAVLLIFAGGCELEKVDESVVIEKPEAVIPPEEDIVEEEIVEDETVKEEIVEEEPVIEKTEIDAPPVVDITERKWTLMVYMSADNNLENAAMEDLCEMECSSLNTDAVTVLALVDRSSAYDTSNGNWSGTRLYKIKTGRNDSSSKMISERIECEPLGLKADVDCEIDMSSDYVLSSYISFCMEKYPAECYGLIIWGHGTGWRGGEGEAYKGFAYDETSRTYMSLRQLRLALENSLGKSRLNVLGFDTCFGGELEVAYELRNTAEYMVGSEGLIMSSGWDYKQLFSEITETADSSLLLAAILSQFKQQYLYSYRASIAVVNMDKVKNLFDAFDGYVKQYAGKITTPLQREAALSALYGPTARTEKYTYGTAGNDIYLDIHTMVEELSKVDSSVSAEEFFEAEKAALETSWASDRENGGLGVYFSTLTEGNYLSVTFPAAYTKEKTANQIQFVTDSEGYVPCKNPASGLIDKLFFTSF